MIEVLNRKAYDKKVKELQSLLELGFTRKQIAHMEKKANHILKNSQDELKAIEDFEENII